VPVARDSTHVGRHDDYLLRQFVAARRAGQEDGARAWWERLVTVNYDRVRGMVRLESRGRLSPVEQDEALQRALLKLVDNMIVTFEGTTMGEWVLSTRRLVHYACMDTQRHEASISKRQRPLDAPGGGDPDAPGRWDAEVYKAVEKRRLEQESLEDDADAMRVERAFLAWALPQLSPTHREVIELDLQGVPGEEIPARVNTSRDAVYQRRHRAMKELAKLREDYEP